MVEDDYSRTMGVADGANLGGLDPRVVKFSPQYKLVFSLLNQDSSAGGAVLDWDIHSLLATHIQPLLSSVAPVHNFTIESQVQYFAPLSVELHEDVGREGTCVVEDDLRAFINSAEWNLASGHTLDPVLHFILYIPSSQTRPLHIQTADGKYAAPAFITPQRGGVVILNPPASSPETPPSSSLALPLSAYTRSFSLFEQQLRVLLGVRSISLSLPSPSASGALTAGEADALIQKRLREAVKESVETLDVIVKLANQIPNMQISKEIQGRVNEALDELDKASASAPFYPSLALSHAARAQMLSSKAYFDPSMLALLYFPDEHKYAVYTPLFGPVSVPLIVALLKEVKEWRKGKKKKKGEGKEGGKEEGVKGKAKGD
ncbi:hypothetical protein JCM11251_000374 [Rhodosporidiobolus azoricus]